MSIYNDWLQAQATLKEAKIAELQLRNAICETHLEDKLEGSLTHKYEDLKITVTAKLNRSVDPVVLEAIWEDLTDEERACIQYKPSIVLAKYRPYESTGGLLMEAVEVKPGQASLKIVEVPEE